MNCRGVSRRLSAFIDNDLSPGIRQAVEEHLQHCLSCKRQLGEFEAIVTAARDLPSLKVTDGFGERVVMSINSQQETKEVLGALRYRFTIAGAAFMVTSAAVFFLVGPPSTDVTSTYSDVQDSLRQSPVTPDFWAHPETKVSSFPVPEGATSQQAIDSKSVLGNDSTVRIEEYVLPDYQRVKETVDRKF